MVSPSDGMVVRILLESHYGVGIPATLPHPCVLAHIPLRQQLGEVDLALGVVDFTGLLSKVFTELIRWNDVLRTRAITINIVGHDFLARSQL
jgi:hypothetical protein